MKIFSIKARVRLESEAKMDAVLLGSDYEEKPEDTYLVWRKVSVQLSHIKNILQYDKDKSLVITYYEPYQYLVKEFYSQLHRRWTEAKKDDDTVDPNDEPDKEDDIDDEDE